MAEDNTNNLISHKSEVSTRSQLATFLLCTFLGFFGAHRLYAGKIGSGITMMLLIIVFVPLLLFSTDAVQSQDEASFGALLSLAAGAVVVLWIIIDWFVILTGNFKDNEGKRIQKLL